MAGVEALWADFRDAVIRAGKIEPGSEAEDFARKCFYAGVLAMIGHLEPQARVMSRYEFTELLHDLGDEFEAWLEVAKQKYKHGVT
jgi:hypothetical protein